MNDPEIPTNAAILINNSIMSICDLENRRKVRKPMNVSYNFGSDLFFPSVICFMYRCSIFSGPPVVEFINETFRMLLDLIDDKSCPGIGRDCALDLVVKFVDRANGCDWTTKFIMSGLFISSTNLPYRFSTNQ